MSGILRLESLTKGNTLKQGDKTPLKYRLFDADGEKLNIAGKSAQVRLVYQDFLTIGYEKDGLTVAQDDTVTFTIDSVIPSRIYHVEIIVDGQFVFPSRSDESKFTVDKSSLGTEANIIEIVGVDQIVGKVLDKIDADVGQVVEDINTTNVTIQQAEADRVLAEQERVQGYQEIQQIIEDGVLNAEPEDGSVGIEKLSFTKNGSNLYNNENATVDTYLDASSGQTYPAANFITSEFIDITGATSLFIKASRRVVFYNKDKVRLSTYSNVSPKYNYTFTSVPSDTVYIRFDYSNSDLTTYGYQQQVNLGSVELPYEPYSHPVIKKEFVESVGLSVEDIADNSITSEKVDFIGLSKNLFDSTTANSGFVNWATGEISSADHLEYFDAIEVEGGQQYIFNKNARMIAYFSATGSYVNGINSPAGNIPITVPTNAKTIVITLEKGQSSGFQFEKGNRVNPYEPYGKRLIGVLAEVAGAGTKVSDMTLPDRIYTTIGEQTKIYTKNLLESSSVTYDESFNSNMTDLKQVDIGLTATPTTQNQWTVTANLFKQSDLLLSKNTQISSRPMRTTKLKGLFIGDSTINAGVETQQVVDKLRDNIELVGTRGVGLNRHEGRGGWKFSMYRTNGVYQTKVNPFYNPTTQDFDFDYYMTENNFSGLDFVFIQLGINDTFIMASDTDLNAELNKIENDANFIIDNILAYQPSLKIGLAITFPPNDSQTMFGEYYGVTQSQFRYKRNNHLLQKWLIETFRDDTRVTLVPLNCVIDTSTQIRDGVHPTDDGYKALGNQVVAWLNHI